ncbi:hypothetical protein B0H14DRAFT_2643178 [Mycena olivaceomarginata]|nr:hypothetical protein B0H14DRAFT_2643178 [Mycena olivaceomarginata]
MQMEVLKCMGGSMLGGSSQCKPGTGNGKIERARWKLDESEQISWRGRIEDEWAATRACARAFGSECGLVSERRAHGYGRDERGATMRWKEGGVTPANERTRDPGTDDVVIRRCAVLWKWKRLRGPKEIEPPRRLSTGSRRGRSAGAFDCPLLVLPREAVLNLSNFCRPTRGTSVFPSDVTGSEGLSTEWKSCRGGIGSDAGKGSSSRSKDNGKGVEGSPVDNVRQEGPVERNILTKSPSPPRTERARQARACVVRGPRKGTIRGRTGVGREAQAHAENHMQMEAPKCIGGGRREPQAAKFVQSKGCMKRIEPKTQYDKDGERRLYRMKGRYRRYRL